jgi:intraflagellar transport protein 81
MAERIAFLVERLNMSPFHKGFSTMSELDSKSSIELLDILCEIVSTIDPDLENIMKENPEERVERVLRFLSVMKYTANFDEQQMADFQDSLLAGDKDVLHTIMYWALQKFEHLQKRAYLAKFLMPVDIPPEFQGEDLILQLSDDLRALQGDFKVVHKEVDQIRQTVGSRPGELKSEIQQLEQEYFQLQSKVSRMKKESHGDDAYFQEMLKATSTLRKEQEEEMRIHERLLDSRKFLQETDMRFGDSQKRLGDLRSAGTQSQSAEQLLGKLVRDVRELQDRRETLEGAVVEREMHMEKLQGWDRSDRVTTDDDVRAKRDQVHDMEDRVRAMQNDLDVLLDRNNKLVVFRQASTMALKKLREKESEMESLLEENRRLSKLQEEKEEELRSKGKGGAGGRVTKSDVKKFGAIVKDKVEKYKKMKEEIGRQREELVLLQRTEQLLKQKDKNIDEFNAELEKKHGVEGFRGTQRALEEMAEKTAEIDQSKGMTLEQISTLVEQITREFKQRQGQLQPLMAELKAMRSEYMDVEAMYNEKKGNYDKVAIGLDMEKSALEKECDNFQEECIREESRFHYLNSLTNIAKIKTERAEQEKKWQSGDGRMMRDFASFKDLYANKLSQQEQMTKALRKKQKELKENAGVMTNQKTNFLNLQVLLETKKAISDGTYNGGGGLVMAEAKMGGPQSMSFN